MVDIILPTHQKHIVHNGICPITIISMSKLENKIANAAKWSVITELIAKTILPISSVVLARLLTPEAFGVVATVSMIVTFAEVFTDAGFHKYLIQHEFNDAIDREQSTNVAFWSNFVMSLILWGIIGLFSEQLAVLVGNPGLGNVITIACISIPLAAFSSIQTALYKRDFDFKTLLKVRIFGVLIPIIVTIPLAVILRSYWAIVIGTITTNCVNAITLTLYSSWKPKFYYSFAKLKEMISFSIWSVCEAISIWLTGYIDIFIIGVCVNEYYLGIYKTSMTTVGHITALITSATTPILFSALSRLQTNKEEFVTLFFKFQKIVATLVVPIGIGIFCFRDLVTNILLGEQWVEAANFIGLWGLTSSITIVLSHYSSEVYRSLGKPKLSVLAQVLHIAALCPAMIIAVQYDWDTIYIVRSLIRLELVLVNIVILYFTIRITLKQLLVNIMPSIVSALIMGIAGTLLLQINGSTCWAIISVLICITIYMLLISKYKVERELLVTFVHKFTKR